MNSLARTHTQWSVVFSFQKKTPLKVACAENDLEIVNLLLDYKAQRRQSAIDLLEVWVPRFDVPSISELILFLCFTARYEGSDREEDC